MLIHIQQIEQWQPIEEPPIERASGVEIVAAWAGFWLAGCAVIYGVVYLVIKIIEAFR